MKWITALGALALAALIPAAAHAQTTPPTPAPAPSHAPADAEDAQPEAANGLTDVDLNIFGTFTTKSVTGNGITQKSANSGGGMMEIRHIQSPWIGYEFTFSWNSDNQTLAPVPGSCGFFCSNTPESLGVKDVAYSVDWVVSRQYGHLRPFLVGGVGFTVAIPSGIPYYYLNNSTKPTTIGGAGFDWALTPKLGVRLQYREDVYTAPHVDPRYPNTGRFTPMGEPMIGVYYRVKSLIPQ